MQKNNVTATLENTVRRVLALLVWTKKLAKDCKRIYFLFRLYIYSANCRYIINDEWILRPCSRRRPLILQRQFYQISQQSNPLTMTRNVAQKSRDEPGAVVGTTEKWEVGARTTCQDREVRQSHGDPECVQSRGTQPSGERRCIWGQYS